MFRSFKRTPSPALLRKERLTHSASVDANDFPQTLIQRLARVDPLHLITYPDQNRAAMEWMAAVGGAAGTAIATLLPKIIGSINFDTWAFERDHKAREDFVKVYIHFCHCHSCLLETSGRRGKQFSMQRQTRHHYQQGFGLRCKQVGRCNGIVYAYGFRWWIRALLL